MAENVPCNDARHHHPHGWYEYTSQGQITRFCPGLPEPPPHVADWREHHPEDVAKMNLALGGFTFEVLGVVIDPYWKG